MGFGVHYDGEVVPVEALFVGFVAEIVVDSVGEIPLWEEEAEGDIGEAVEVVLDKELEGEEEGDETEADDE